MNLFSLPATSLTPSAAAVSDLAGGLFGSGAKTSDGPSFAQTLQSAFGQVNALQDHAGQMAQSFARGQTGDIHSVMIAGEQATVALQLTAQIRNKAVDAYQEIMRISM